MGSGRGPQETCSFSAATARTDRGLLAPFCSPSAAALSPASPSAGGSAASAAAAARPSTAEAWVQSWQARSGSAHCCPEAPCPGWSGDCSGIRGAHYGRPHSRGCRAGQWQRGRSACGAAAPASARRGQAAHWPCGAASGRSPASCRACSSAAGGGGALSRSQAPSCGVAGRYIGHKLAVRHVGLIALGRSIAALLC